MIEHQYFDCKNDYCTAVRVTILNCYEDDYDPVVELWVERDYLFIRNDFHVYQVKVEDITKIELYDREFIQYSDSNDYYWEDFNFKTIYEVKNV